MIHELDLRKKLQDQANDIVNKALKMTSLELDSEIVKLLKGIVMMSLRQGFIWSCTTNQRINQYLLDDIGK